MQSVFMCVLCVCVLGRLFLRACKLLCIFSKRCDVEFRFKGLEAQQSSAKKNTRERIYNIYAQKPAVNLFNGSLN